MKTLAGLFVMAVLVRVVAMVALGTWNFDPSFNHWAAGWETGRIAGHLANGEGFSLELGRGWNELSPTAWLAPLYPAFVGGVFTVFGSFSKLSLILVLLFQILCDGGTCLQLTKIGQRLGHRRAGCLGAALFALSPASINMSVRVLWCTSLLTFLCATLVARMLGHAEQGPASPERRVSTWKAWIGTGALIGLTLLTSPTPAIYVGFASLALILRDPRHNLRAVATMALVAIAIVAPWIVRNQRVLGALFFIKSNIGNELFIGNNPSADGAHHGPQAVAKQVLSEGQYAELAEMNEVERAGALGSHAMAWIADNPGRFGELTLKRFWTYWTAPFLDQWELLPLGPLKPIAPLAYGLGRWALLAAAASGAFLMARDRRNAVPLLAFLALFPAAYFVTHAGVARYRFPVVPYLFLLAALPLDALWQARKGKRPALPE